MDEVWKKIPGYGDHYEASSYGRIRVKDRIIVKKLYHGGIAKQHYKQRILRPAKRTKYGHLSVTIGIDGVDYSVSVHTLILLAFVGPRPDGHEACHGNGEPSDNRPENLRWDTHLANNNDRKKHGRYASGEKHHAAKLDLETVEKIRACGLSVSKASTAFNISRSQAWRIMRGFSW